MGTATENALENYKGFWHEVCGQIAQMCHEAGAHPDAPPDAWTLRLAIMKLREESRELHRLRARVLCVDPQGEDPLGAFTKLQNELSAPTVAVLTKGPEHGR